MADSLKMLSSSNNIKTLLTIASLFIGVIVQTLTIIAGRLGRPNFSEQDIHGLKDFLGEENFATVKHLIGNPNMTHNSQEILAVGQLIYQVYLFISSIYNFFFGPEEQSDGNVIGSVLYQVYSLASIIKDGVNLYQDFNTESPSIPLRRLVE
jgi:hypothetical protein